jgi:hypothetical protein
LNSRAFSANKRAPPGNDITGKVEYHASLTYAKIRPSPRLYVLALSQRIKGQLEPAQKELFLEWVIKFGPLRRCGSDPLAKDGWA